MTQRSILALATLLILGPQAGCTPNSPTVRQESPVKAASELRNSEDPQKKSTTEPSEAQNKEPKVDLAKVCREKLADMPGKFDQEQLDKTCQKVELLNGCQSVEGQPIFHYDKISEDTRGKRILTLSLIHGDERAAGTVARSWMFRLFDLESRNSWRVIPMVNPDGWDKNIRMNANGVDLNRNFPSEDWNEMALKRWKEERGSDPRRFPGASAASELETQCVMKHIADFKPDFIISVHTPLGVLDFDGPRLGKFPAFSPLPWISLGNFPGSLGRYMWKDNNVPVLTIELKGSHGVDRLESFDQLQDVSGTVAIQVHRWLSQQSQKKESQN